MARVGANIRRKFRTAGTLFKIASSSKVLETLDPPTVAINLQRNETFGCAGGYRHRASIPRMLTIK